MKIGLFLHLLISCFIMEFAVYALFISSNQLYLLPLFISTTCMVYIAYLTIKDINKSKLEKHYFFYFAEKGFGDDYIRINNRI